MKTIDEQLEEALARIGEVAGREAMEAFRPADPVANYGLDYSGSAMKGWATADQSVAKAYIDSLPPGKFRHGMINEFILGVGPIDVATCRTLLATLPVNEQQQTLAESLSGHDGLHFHPLVRAWLDSRESENPAVNNNARFNTFNALVSQQRSVRWADPSGEKLLTWLNSFSGKPYVTAQVVNEAAGVAARDNPVTALTWIETFTQTNPTSGKAAFVNVMTGFARNQLTEATKWLDENRGNPFYGEAVVGLLNARGDQMDNATVDAWVDTIADERARTNVAKAVATRRQGKRDDAKQAVETALSR